MRTLTRMAAVAAGIIGCGAATQAGATVYMFALTGEQTADFSIDTDLTPPAAKLNRIEFTGIAGTFNGTNAVAPYVRFFDAGSGGGFNVSFGGPVGYTLVIDNIGPQLFAGTPDDPSFVAGRYTLSTGTLAITGGPAVPEVATWTLMLTGFAGVGLALRRQRGHSTPALVAGV